MKRRISFRLFTRETYGERKASWLNKITKFEKLLYCYSAKSPWIRQRNKNWLFSNKDHFTPVCPLRTKVNPVQYQEWTWPENKMELKFLLINEKDELNQVSIFQNVCPSLSSSINIMSIVIPFLICWNLTCFSKV